MKTSQRSNVVTIGIAFAAFTVLGMPSGLLGLAWPSIRETFGLSQDNFGLLAITGTIGYVTASASSGRMMARLGVGLSLALGSAVAGIGLLGYALAPAWWMIIGAATIASLGAGVTDAGLNTYVANNFSGRIMNWLHGFFGVGATIGPLIMTTVFSMELSWHWGYVIVAVLSGAIALTYGLTLNRWILVNDGQAETATTDSKPAPQAAALDTLRLPLVWLSIALFAVYAGVENTAGQWTYSLFTESRGIAETTAGHWVSIYWGSFTVGRFLFGVIADHINTTWLLRVGMVCVVVGAVLVWLQPSAILGFLGLALMGIAISPVFALLVTQTPGWAGPAHTANVIGFQVGAAGFGYALLPALAGVLVANLSLEIIGPYLLVISIIMSVLYEAVVILSHRKPRLAAA